jgi:hypothetical protein
MKQTQICSCDPTQPTLKKQPQGLQLHKKPQLIMGYYINHAHHTIHSTEAKPDREH